MNNMLKGTYQLKKDSKPLVKKRKKVTSVEEFEARAIEKLGGSIAFVSKANLVWSGEDDKIK